ncbi:MAG: hypothetical protein PUA76_03895 [Bacteroidales bacterium]|nr:hypothetical protein [Bacteroidales bacterium]
MINSILRYFFRLLILSGILISFVLATTGCSCTSFDANEKADCEAAAHYGREQALVLSEQNAPDTILMEQVLVDVRVREAEMRRKGHNTIADAYIEAFIATLDSVNPSLNQLISAEK